MENKYSSRRRFLKLSAGALSAAGLSASAKNSFGASLGNETQENSEARQAATIEYSKVRFIGYAVPTTATDIVPIGNVNGKGSFCGYYIPTTITNSEDISCKTNFLYQAIQQADEKIDQADNTINIFVAPEFFFRGKNGPFLWDSSKGDTDPYTDLKTKLTGLLSIYKNWIFVCGSLVTLDSPETIDDLLVNYGFRNQEVNSLCNEYVRLMQDQKYDDAAAKGVEIREYVQNSHGEYDCKVKNRSIIVNNINNPVNNSLSTEKNFISNEDLPLAPSNLVYQVITEQMSAYPDIDLSNGDVKSKTNPDDPYAIFNCQYSSDNTNNKGITNIGVEICLDHSDNRLRKNFTKNNDILAQENLASVHIQLIPSCGMEIHEDGVVADTNGLVFNCDGEYSLPSSPDGVVPSLYQNYTGNWIDLPYKSPVYPDGKYWYAAHSQLARVSFPALGDTPGDHNAILEPLTERDIDTQRFDVDQSNTFNQFFSGGSGQLHFYGLDSPITLYPNDV